MEYKLKQDLQTFRDSDIEILVKYYNIPNVPLIDQLWLLAINISNSVKTDSMVSGSKSYFDSLSDKVNTLNKIDREILLGYTNDLSLDNSDKIAEIIESFPELASSVTVYRGTKSPGINPDYWFSTSLDSNHVITEFTGDKCCLLEIHVKPGVKTMPVYNLKGNKFREEKEIIIQGGQQLKLVDESSRIKPDGSTIKVYHYEYSPPVIKSSETKEFIDSIDITELTQTVKEELELFNLEFTPENIKNAIDEIYENMGLNSDDLEVLYQRFNHI